MRPISFHKAEVLFKSNDPDIAPLPVLSFAYADGDECLVSCWKPSFGDILRILIGRPIFLALLGGAQPPVSLETDRLKIMDRDGWERDRYSANPKSHHQPVKVFELQKEMPGIPVGSRFQQSVESPNIYFHAIPIRSDTPGADQVGIIKFEAQAECMK